MTSILRDTVVAAICGRMSSVGRGNMWEASLLVNANVAGRDAEWVSSAQGRTAVRTLKLGSEKGRTRAWLNARLRQVSAEVPAAEPLMCTSRTLPLESNTTVEREGALCPATQVRAAPSTAPIAFCAAPMVGRAGRDVESARSRAAGTSAGAGGTAAAVDAATLPVGACTERRAEPDARERS